MYFDEVLEQIGEGIFQKFAIFVCGLATLAEAIATTSVPFAMILVSCDLKISIEQILALNAVLFVAMTISGYWLGGISDMSGRKYILSMTSIITFVGCFVASFSQCVVMLFISLFLLGLGLGGNHSATRIFIIEITPKSCRGKRLIILEVFSAVGYAAAIGLSRLLVPPLASSLAGNYIRLNSWRILFGLSGSLSIFSACLMSVFPASPRWLLGKKQEEEAIDILRKIYAINKVKHEESFPNIHLEPITFVSTAVESQLQCNNPLFRSFRSIRIYTQHLFSKKFIKTTMASILINMFFFDGLIMMNLWLGLVVFYTDMNECSLNGAIPIIASSSSEMCHQTTLENLFKVNAYFSLCSFVVLILLCVADKIPRKYILMASSLMAGLSALSLALLSIPEMLRIFLAFVVLSSLFIAEVTLRIIIFESYPTVLRSTAYGFIKIFSKVSLVFLIMFLNTNCSWTFTGFGTFFVCAGLLSPLLPCLNNLPMRE